jgi:hypothetical protein
MVNARTKLGEVSPALWPAEEPVQPGHVGGFDSLDERRALDMAPIVLILGPD